MIKYKCSLTLRDNPKEKDS